MEQLYEAASLSRQAFHKWLIPTDKQIERTPAKLVLELAHYVRWNYLPGSSAREVYAFIRKRKDLQLHSKLLGWGKHAFENLCLANGLRIVSKRFRPKTTIRGDYVFPNLIEGMVITNINLIWVSDICYIFDNNGKLLGYATSLIDIYSRLLLGLSFSKTMRAIDTSLAVLKQAFKCRDKASLIATIFHSDGGKQYIYKPFLKMLDTANIQSSMAENCYENPHAESFNDTLKNHILLQYDLNSFTQLKKQEKFIKYSYNNYKVHTGIERFTPIEYEQFIKTLQPFQRTKLEIKIIEN